MKGGMKFNFWRTVISHSHLPSSAIIKVERAKQEDQKKENEEAKNFSFGF